MWTENVRYTHTHIHVSLIQAVRTTTTNIKNDTRPYAQLCLCVVWCGDGVRASFLSVCVCVDPFYEQNSKYFLLLSFFSRKLWKCGKIICFSIDFMHTVCMCVFMVIFKYATRWRGSVEFIQACISRWTDFVWCVVKGLSMPVPPSSSFSFFFCLPSINYYGRFFSGALSLSSLFKTKESKRKKSIKLKIYIEKVRKWKRSGINHGTN